MTDPSLPGLDSMKSAIGRQLLHELFDAQWDLPTQRVLNHFGLALGTHLGMTRRRNEDRLAVASVRTNNGQCFFVAIVCDGVGGSENGDIASTLAIAACLEELVKARLHQTLEDLVITLVNAMDQFVRKVLKGRGTTTASLVILDSSGRLVATNIGDSRIFSWSRKEMRIRQVTVDDTIENELKQLSVRDSGMIDAHGLRGRLSQAIGEGHATHADLRIVTYNRDQFPEGILIATDGAWKGGEMAFNMIASQSKSALDTIRRTIAYSNWAGGLDNVSLIAIEDLSRIAEAGFLEIACLQVSGNEAKVVAWFSDTKLVILERVNTALKQSDDEFEPEKFSINSKIQKSKTAIRKRKSKLEPLDVEQMGLLSDEEGKRNAKKPIVEISTDESTGREK